MSFLKRMVVKVSSRIYVFSQIPTVLRILPTRARRKALHICLFMICVGIFEVGVVAFIGAFVVSITDSGFLLNNRYVAAVLARVGMADIKHFDFLLLCGIMITVLQVMKMILRVGVDYAVQTYTASVDAIAGEKIMQRILTMEYQEANVKHTPAKLFEFVSWRVYFGSNYLRVVMGGLQSLIIALSMSVTMIVAQPVLTLLLYAFFGTVGLGIYKLFGSRMDRASKKYRDGSVEVSGQASMIYGGIREIKLSGLERLAIKPFSSALEKLIVFRARVLLLLRVPSQLMESFGIVALVVIVLVLVDSSASSSDSLAIAAIFAVAAQRILVSTKAFMDDLNAMRSVAPYIARVESEFSIANVPDLPPPPEKDERFRYPRRIELDKVGFQYPDASCAAVHDICFVWEEGVALGIIGLSGAGKSTLIDVLAGLFLPTEGAVRVDGADVHGPLRRSWMQSVAYIAQNPFIFAGTLLDNIALPFNPEMVDRERALWACKAANIDFMNDARGGIDMPLTAGGLNLSGGQRQRVVVARALYQDCPVIIMDEPTSAMDIANERIFGDVVSALAKERRIAIISHKLDTVAHCDMVLWLGNGKLRMAGPPGEVLPAFAAHAERRENGD